jgi:hypothetical protein
MSIKVTPRGDGSFEITCNGMTMVVWPDGTAEVVSPYIYDDPNSRPGSSGGGLGPPTTGPRGAIVIAKPGYGRQGGLHTAWCKLDEFVRAGPTTHLTTLLRRHALGLNTGAPLLVDAHAGIGSTYDLGTMYQGLSLYEPQVDHPIVLRLQSQEPPR